MCGIGLIFGQQDSDFTALEHILRFRGPDVHTISYVDSIGWLIGCVLHIQGDHITTQPYRDADGNLLLWNGEVFGHCDGTGALVHTAPGDIPGTESDTAVVSKIVLAVLKQCEDAIEEESSTGGDKGGKARRQLLATIGNAIAIALSSIAGPYAFIIVCPRFRCVVYGRDPFGRRSLLVHSTGGGALLSIASVRPLQPPATEDALQSSSSAMSSAWTEVPVTGIFVVSACENVGSDPRPLQVPWPEHRLRLGRLSRNATALVPDPSKESAGQMLLHSLTHAIRVRVRAMRACAPATDSDTTPDGPRAARLGVLFSGGIDSVVLAAILHLCLDDADEPIDLLNISFENTATATEVDLPAPDRLAAIAAVDELHNLYPRRPFRLVHVDVPAVDRLAQEDRVKQLIYPCKTHMDLNIGMAFHSAACARNAYVRVYTDQEILAVRSTCDAAGRPLVRLGGGDAAKAVGLVEWRQATPAVPRGVGESEGGSGVEPVRSCGSGSSCRRVGKKGCLRGLCKRCCNAKENSAADGLFCPVHKSRLAATLSARSGLSSLEEGAEYGAEGNHVSPYRTEGGEKLPYKSTCKALLIGIGADEHCAGYGRHRTTFLREGVDALEAELDMDCRRLWERNLGRDDRCVSDSGREAWFPYLDEGVVQLLQSLPISALCDLTRPPGEGDKVIVRQVASLLGLKNTATLVKRAIQFGTKIAKLTNIACHGSKRKGKGDTLMGEG